MLKTVDDGEFAEGASIRFFVALPDKIAGKKVIKCILVLTDIHLIYIEDYKNVEFVCYLQLVDTVEVYVESLKDNKKMHHLFLTDKLDQQFMFHHESYSVLDKIYSILTM